MMWRAAWVKPFVPGGGNRCGAGVSEAIAAISLHADCKGDDGLHARWQLRSPIGGLEDVTSAAGQWQLPPAIAARRGVWQR